jgi:hypothetical protein
MTPGQLYVSISTLSAKEAVKLIQQTKNEWCKEQRENCAEIITKDSYECTIKENRERILNAPEP